MILLGLDIASYKTGYFVMDIENIRFKIGLLEMKGSQFDRIRQVGKQAKDLLNLYQPSIIVIESTYLDQPNYKKGVKKRGNVDTLKILEKCHGAIITNTEEYMDIHYMSPNEHKELIAGMGNASKKATIWSIQKKLGLTGIDDNMADAAALVLSYLMKREQWDILEQFNKKYSK